MFVTKEHTQLQWHDCQPLCVCCISNLVMPYYAVSSNEFVHFTCCSILAFNILLCNFTNILEWSSWKQILFLSLIPTTWINIFSKYFNSCTPFHIFSQLELKQKPHGLATNKFMICILNQKANKWSKFLFYNDCYPSFPVFLFLLIVQFYTR